jgi:hypothetical protein
VPQPKKAAPKAAPKPKDDDDLAGFGFDDDTPTPAAAAPEEEPTTDAGDAATDDASEADNSDIDTSVSDENIKSSSAGGGDKYLNFKNDGDKYEVRFLDDLRGGFRAPKHEDWKGGLRPTTCYRVYGKKCPYCEKGVPTKWYYAWNVIDFKTGKVKVLVAKGTQRGIPIKLSAIFAERDTICDVNYVLKQVGAGTEKSFEVIQKDRNDPEAKAKIKKAILALKDKKHDLKDAMRPKGLGNDGEETTSGDDFEVGID